MTVNLGFDGSGVVANDGFGTADTFTGIEGVRASAFADVLNGSDRTDRVERFEGMGGNDTITGGLGTDQVNFFQSPTSVIVNLSAAAVTVGSVTVDPNRAMDGFGGIDTLSGIEWAAGSEFNDTFIGGAEASQFFGEGGDDTLLGGDGSDTVFGGAGFDSLDGGNGTDRADYSEATSAVTVNLADGIASDGFGTTDTLISIEQVTGSDFDDTLTGDINANLLEGGVGNDTISGGAGDDDIFGDDGNDVIIGGDGNDTIRGGAGNDSLTGGDGNDSIRGGGGNDTLLGGDGDDRLQQSPGADLLDGGAGFDTLDFTQTGITYGGATGVVVNLAAGTSDSGGAGIATISSFEIVFGTAGNDVFVGGDPLNVVDTLGNRNGERFRPGAGDDTITGGADVGLNTTVDYANNTSAQAVSVNLYTGIASDGLGGIDTLVNVERVLGGAGDDLLVGGSLSRNGAGNFQEYLRGNAGNDTLDGGDAQSGAIGIDRVEYSNNTSAQAINVDLGAGTASDGLGGTDTLIDIQQVFGGAGNDTLTGSAGNDLFDGGAGNDTLNGASGSDRAQFVQSPAGVIVNLSASPIVVGADTVAGGTAHDGFGSTDTLIDMEEVRGSDFNDYIRGSDDTSIQERFDGDAGNDTIDGGAGIDFASYQATVLALGGVNAFIENGSGTVTDPMGGTDTLTNIEGLIGTNSNDTLAGGLGDQWFRGRGGSDSINGGAGNDWVSYSDDRAGVTVNLATGTATDGWNGPGGLLALGGTDTLISIENAEGSDFADSIVGSAGANELRGGAGNDQLFGDADNDTLTGGAGDDLLNGGENPAGQLGDTDYVDYSAEGGPGAVTVNLATGIATDTFGDSDTLLNIERVIGTSFADTLTGGDVTILDTNRSENFEGRAGDDVITGGGIAAGFGAFAVYRNAPSGIVVNLTSSAIDLDPGAGTDLIAAGTARDGYGAIDTLAEINRIGGSAFADLIYGSDSPLGGNERFEGRAGADTIHGGGRIDYLHYQNSPGAVTVNLGFDGSGVVADDGFGTADTFTGIEGVRASAFADVLNGSDRTDQVERFEGMGGDDTITGGLGIDRVEFFQSPTSVIVNLSAAVVTVGSVTVDPNSAMDGFGGIDTLSGIERADASRFNDTLIGGAEANELNGGDGDGNDTLLGGDGNDTLIGGAGFDSLDGGNGTDRADYSEATGAVTVNLADGSASNDGFGTIDTLISIEQVTGSDFDDALTGDINANLLEGGVGNDTISGGAGDDDIFGDDDNDVIIGGDGNDTIRGGEGNDSLTGGDGNDSIRGGGGNDTLLGGDGNDDLNGRAGFDLLVGGAGGDTFRWGAGDQGTVALPAIDTISDFDLVANSDKLDLRGLLQGENSGNLTDYLHFTSDGTDTTIEVKSQGALGDLDQEIVLVGVDLTLIGIDSEIISSLILNGNLITD